MANISCENIECDFNTFRINSKKVCQPAQQTETEAEYQVQVKPWGERASQTTSLNINQARKDQAVGLIQRMQAIISQNCRRQDYALKNALQRYKKTSGI